ncbi:MULTISPECIES: hypothetical protein [Microbulbifer]|uniref:Uncharacterized protein n=1 Tax=Microbulbifer celer TaxID=435905 RepID=A0ABW3U4W8_9GAMM|nr:MULTISPECIES: hypothetical protein [Microbulbifer]UFN56692.1 hypothetical protein LPW13_14110 [Microbulbifer celer]
MEFNAQIANWLMTALGGLSSWIVIAACVLLALNIFLRVRFLRSHGQGMHWLLDRTLVIRFLCLLFFIWVLIGFNSNGPRLVLQPDYSAEEEARARALRHKGELDNLAPVRESAEETSKKLEQLREAQKSESTDG